jgi:hypothetical protein
MSPRLNSILMALPQRRGWLKTTESLIGEQSGE